MNKRNNVGCSTLSKAAITAAILTMVCGSVSAEETVMPVYTLDAVIVTATRTENTIKNVPEATEVFTQKDFKTLGAQDVRSALQLATNVYTGEAGMTGNQVMLRGMNSAQTLILINGKRMAAEDTSETANAYELNRISLSNVDRIEVVRGNSSTLYGSDAMGGVINIITKRAETEGLTIGANTGSREMNNYYHYDFGQIGKFNGSIDANFKKMRRFSWNDDNNTTLYGPRQNFSFDGEYKIRDNRILGMNLSYMKDHMRMDYNDGKYALNKYQSIDSERKEASLDYHVKTDASDFMIRTYYNQLKKENDTYNQMSLAKKTISGSPVPVVIATPLASHIIEDFDRATYDTFVVEGRDTTKLSDHHRLTVGSEYRYLKYKGTRLGDNGSHPDTITVGSITKDRSETSMNFVSGYLQDEWRPTEKLLLISSIRYDHSDKFGSNVAPKLGLTYKFQDHLRFKANYGRGFRAPTLSELYMRFDGLSMVAAAMPTVQDMVIYGNPNLKPEKSLGYDFRLEGEHRSAFGAVSYFHNKVDNLIDTVITTVTDPITHMPTAMYAHYYNVDSAKLEGIEAEVGYQLNDRWTMKGTWNYLNAVNADTGVRLDNRGNHYGTVQLLYNDHKEHSISGVLWYQYMNDFQTSEKLRGQTVYHLNGYHTWNLSVSKQWNDHLSTFVGVNNILDDAVPAICIAGRTWRTGVEWKF